MRKSGIFYKSFDMTVKIPTAKIHYHTTLVQSLAVIILEKDNLKMVYKNL